MGESAELELDSLTAGRPACIEPGLEERIEEAVRTAARHLLSLQHQEGFWHAELQADTTLESDYILYLHFIGKPDRARVRKLANYIRPRQLSDGGWNIYDGGPSELNATVKAYLALRLAGDAPSLPHMERAKHRVHELGGLEHTNSFTRFYLALAGAIGWDMVPAVPPELMLAPNWFYLNIYEMSSWTRAIVVPLMILYSYKPSWKLPDQICVDELFRNPDDRTASFRWDRRPFTWRNFFLTADRLFKLYDRLPWKPLRDLALRRARQWMLEHLERSDGLGAIYPAMMNSIFALVAMGHSADDPLTAREIRQLARFELEEEDTIRLQPCFSPIWDTAVAMVALEEAGLPPNHPALVRAARWMLDQQILGPGDWQLKNPRSKPGGWAFEFRNDYFPDVDDTAFVLQALQRVDFPDRRRLEESLRRGLAWMIGMQNQDGGWGAFDKDNDCAILTQVPFADHNAMIDPSSEDVTARVIECLARFGWTPADPVIKRALAYLLRNQEPDGSWYGRWGVNYIYGTSGVLRAMEPLGLMLHEAFQKARTWLRSVQNPDGGFGETCLSYDDPAMKAKGPSTPSQTAWGIIGLLAAGETNDAVVQRAVQFLLERQNADGSWDEDAFTGTGFPRVFYLKYHLYRNAFPLYALARYRNLVRSVKPFSAVQISPQQFERRNGSRARR
jgi:squalene-hopene/tetraprenyl-beta-curcumene cyclase